MISESVMSERTSITPDFVITIVNFYIYKFDSLDEILLRVA